MMVMYIFTKNNKRCEKKTLFIYYLFQNYLEKMYNFSSNKIHRYDFVNCLSYKYSENGFNTSLAYEICI